MVVAITAYGMATFEGPMLSIKSINALSHFTDWTIAHVHVGALGWNGLLTFGILYWLVPRLYNTGLYSKKLANLHFWIATLGMIFYAIPMYWAGITQGLMWKEFTAEGYLQYPIFLETVLQIIPMYHIRAFGGIIYFTGVFVMAYNLIKTAKSGSLVANEEAQAPALQSDKSHAEEKTYFHRWIERKPVQFIIATVIAVAIGGLVEIIPTFLVKSNIPTITSVNHILPSNLKVEISMFVKGVILVTRKWYVLFDQKQSVMVNIQKLVNLSMIIHSSGDQNEPVQIFKGSGKNIRMHGIIIICSNRNPCLPVL